MPNVRSTCVLVAVLLAGPAVAAPRAAGVVPSDAEIRRILAERLGAASRDCGIVVGIVDPRGRRVVAYGHVDAKDPRPLSAGTTFEIASVTKVFTALLLADMARRGEVSLDDPVAKLLPPGIRVPERDGRKITLADLATHTSGLPFMADDLSRLELARGIGAEWDYSNVGYWLLGRALAARAGMDFERLLQARVLGPLGLKSTAITITPRLKKRMAVGHDAALGAARVWSWEAAYADMGAAGGLVSTVRDLQTLLAAALGLEPTPLKAGLDSMLATRRPMPGGEQALGW
ncbi:MAG TPA: serine hydrolase domain-containing protein, partial [Planctomycetota bacterium]|nr:serine hydrolase domain-containing protein [Planctomycetota bacterium]